MTIRDERRQAAIERMADHILAEGLGAATLRPLAAAAGVSDRMLLYYFADKDEVLAATLERIAARMVAQLDRAVPAEPRLSFSVLLEAVWAALDSLSLRPFMHVWLDLASGAARGVQPHRHIAGAIADGFLAWTAARLDHEGDASRFMATFEGLYLLKAIGRGDMANAALADLIARPGE